MPELTTNVTTEKNAMDESNPVVNIEDVSTTTTKLTANEVRQRLQNAKDHLVNTEKQYAETRARAQADIDYWAKIAESAGIAE